MHFVYSLAFSIGLFSFCPVPLFVDLTPFLYMFCILSGRLIGFFLFNISVLFIHKKMVVRSWNQLHFFSPLSVLAFIGLKKILPEFLYSRCILVVYTLNRLWNLVLLLQYH